MEKGMKEKKIFALGFFDGVHIGHQRLLEKCAEMARSMGCRTAAITFDRHPQACFVAEPPALISTVNQRKMLLEQYHMEEIVVYPVTKEVMSTSWRDFLTELVDNGAAGFVCGYDFRFGRKGEGNAEKLQAFCEEKGLLWAVLPEQTEGGEKISSTRIRQLLEAGRLSEANHLLGHPYMLSGTVVQGRQLGRTIGVPTANIRLPREMVVPKRGVYAGTCHLDGKEFVAVTNIGSRPTVEGHEVRAESWILDFAGDLYGKELTLQLHQFLRPEQKFNSLEELKAQIQQDALQARRTSQ